MNAVAVALTLAALWFVEKMLGTPMVIRPIVVAPLIGLELGDLKTGLLIGAELELVFMGAVQIGGAVPPDVLVGAGLGTAFAVMNNAGAEVALALALPIAIVAQSLKVVVFIIRSWFMSVALKLAGKADITGLKWLNIAGLLLQCLMYFVVCYYAISLGADAVQGLIAGIPDKIMSGLRVAGGLLPAVGFALLLQPMMNNRNFIYFLIGFVLVAYLNLPILGITILGIATAYVVCYEKQTAAAPAKSEKEDLFDE